MQPEATVVSGTIRLEYSCVVNWFVRFFITSVGPHFHTATQSQDKSDKHSQLTYNESLHIDDLIDLAVHMLSMWHKHVYIHAVAIAY